MLELVLEIGKGLGKFFLHPVFYFSIIWVMAAGFFRIKRERRDFHIRIQEPLHELRSLFPAGIVVGVILTVLFIAIGMTIPLSFLSAIAIATMVLTVIGNARLLSPAFTIGLPIVAVLIIQLLSLNLSFFPVLETNYFIGAALLMGVLVMVEGILMLKNGKVDVSPKLRTSRRGLTVGAMQAKRFWLLPFFLFLPTGSIVAPFEWWPVIHWGTESYSLILLPFLLGFQQQIQTTLPEKAIERLGKQILLLGIIVTVIAATSIFSPIYISGAATAIAILGRIWIAYRHRVKENTTPYYFAPRNNGVMVLGVLPDSPAEKLGLKTGEIIQTCNQVKINNKDELYRALLKNRAYCKLEVFDQNGEIRFVQGALYEGDHHELGILFIDKRNKSHSPKAI
ncbi:PDZ domain-containing protein [Bacillus niameyensis]|uniref:PDZ domain-containing protein n=1 Tax=Bacillus niameyensis TaxID=1522308 RepID=UPI000781485A|nr:PDZ domain-containing protein [Bacillus niameyensis]